MTAIRTASAIVTAVIATACSSLATPDLQVPLTSPGGEAYTLLIYDDTSLVQGGQSADWRRGGASENIIAFPETRQVEVTWTGGACQHTPTLQVTGGPGDLRLNVNNPNDPQWLPFLPLACPAVGVPLTVKLTLSQPVEQDAAHLEVHWR